MRALYLGTVGAYVALLLVARVHGFALFLALLTAPIVALFGLHVSAPVAALIFPPSLERDRAASLSLFGR